MVTQNILRTSIEKIGLFFVSAKQAFNRSNQMLYNNAPFIQLAKIQYIWVHWQIYCHSRCFIQQMGLQRLPSVLEGLLSVQNLLKYRHKRIKIFSIANGNCFNSCPASNHDCCCLPCSYCINGNGLLTNVWPMVIACVLRTLQGFPLFETMQTRLLG